MKPSLVVIILTHNEELHIERCILSLLPVAKKIFIVDSFSTDRTVALATALGATVHQRAWKNYADQFQWGLDNCGADHEWIMRMDADEYLEPELQNELIALLPSLRESVTGVYIRRKVIFYGHWMRHGGTYPQVLLRIWRAGFGRIEQRWMDEHIVFDVPAITQVASGHLVDENIKGITFWTEKCNKYASREMVDLLNNKYSLLPRDESLKSQADSQAKWKRMIKDIIYSRLPIGLRSSLYFLYRYFVRLGFLDGRKGFLWHFLQGYWYRMLVDVKIMEIEERSGGDVDEIRRILINEHGIQL
ncbi:MAG: glycosyltransferase family 2 protein [Porticoccaceae bacterium]